MQDCTNAELFKRYKDLSDEMDKIGDELKNRDIEWQHLASYGLRHLAIMAYRKKHKTELREAYEAVNAFITELKVEALMYLNYGK